MIEQPIKENQNEVYLFSDSWAIENGITIWNGMLISYLDTGNKDIWQKTALADISTFITHVSAHQKYNFKGTKFNTRWTNSVGKQ